MNPEEDTPRAEPVVSEVRVDYRDFYPEKPNAGLHAEPLPVQPVSAEKQPEEPAAALVLEAPKEAPKTEASAEARRAETGNIFIYGMVFPAAR